MKICDECKQETEKTYTHVYEPYDPNTDKHVCEECHKKVLDKIKEMA